MNALDERIRSVLAAGEIAQATTLVLRDLGPEILGFLSGVLGDDDADEVFSAFSVRLWRSLEGFQGRCSVRTWAYVLARREIGRFRRGMRRHADGRVPISELQEVLVEVRTKSRSRLTTDKQRSLTKLRDELPVEDRTLLILRVDRGLSWDDIALAFAEEHETFSEEDTRRESARLRKRFQLIKRRLAARVRQTFAS
jgi:RNA polymerase sigma-70 factor (ECF subfamily)